MSHKRLPSQTVMREVTPSACPVCRSTETVDEIIAERAALIVRLIEKCRSDGRPFVEPEVQPTTPGGITRAQLDLGFVTCVGCGALYDPFFEARIAQERKNIEILRDRLDPPLLRLAQQAE